MSELMETFTAESAITYGQQFDGQFHKYRAIVLPRQSELALPSSLIDNSKEGLTVQSYKNKSIPARIPIVSTKTTQLCPERPLSCTVPNSFNANEISYEKVKQLIEKALVHLEDYQYDWSYFENEHNWKCKFLQGSNLREFHIYCYWDSRNEDHVIEVKRIKGDGFSTPVCSTRSNSMDSSSLSSSQLPQQQSSVIDLFSTLKTFVTNSHDLDDGVHKQRGKLRSPLPFSSDLVLFPTAKKNSSSSLTSLLTLPMCCSFNPKMITMEQFLEGIKPIAIMVNDSYYEPRLEASKMLCDLSSKELKLITLPECMKLVIHSLKRLIVDEFDEVKQFAIIAFALFAEIEDYQHRFMEEFFNLPHEACEDDEEEQEDDLGFGSDDELNIVLITLLNLISNSPKEIPSYQTAQIRRKSAYGLLQLANCNSKQFVKILKLYGFQEQENWMNHCVTILDKKTREYAQQIGNCYNS